MTNEEKKSIERIEDFLTTNKIVSISSDDTADSEELKVFISKNEYLAIEFIANMFLKQSKEIEDKIRNKFVSKDKIKAKIEENKKLINECLMNDNKIFCKECTEKCGFNQIIDVLQSLLEEEQMKIEELKKGKEYISKDKIKAKIEELKQKKYILSSKDSEIEILQSLLEEE